MMIPPYKISMHVQVAPTLAEKKDMTTPIAILKNLPPDGMYFVWYLGKFRVDIASLKDILTGNKN